jgi:hypothetical protein
MHNLVILLKTFVDDLKYVERLIPSYNKYNRDNIPLYFVVPEADINVFQRFSNLNVEILSEELFNDKLTSVPVFGMKPGYINQQIIKLSFWELQLSENYFCLDSDGEFIRDFFISDFMYDERTPYSILIEDNELKVEPEYYNSYWVPREEKIRLIQELVGLNDRRMLTCHGMAVLSCKVLASFKTEFMISKNLSYVDILNLSPYEFSWYNMWLQKSKVIPIEIREPLFKMFHHENHLKDYVRRFVTLEDIARGFIGININSNWQLKVGGNPIHFQDYKLEGNNLSNLSIKDLSSAILKKIRNRIKIK